MKSKSFFGAITTVLRIPYSSETSFLFSSYWLSLSFSQVSYRNSDSLPVRFNYWLFLGDSWDEVSGITNLGKCALMGDGLRLVILSVYSVTTVR